MTQHWVGLPAGELAHEGEALAVAGMTAAAKAIDAAPRPATMDRVRPAVSLEVMFVSNLFAESTLCPRLACVLDCLRGLHRICSTCGLFPVQRYLKP